MVAKYNRDLATIAILYPHEFRRRMEPIAVTLEIAIDYVEEAGGQEAVDWAQIVFGKIFFDWYAPLYFPVDIFFSNKLWLQTTPMNYVLCCVIDFKHKLWSVFLCT